MSAVGLQAHVVERPTRADLNRFAEELGACGLPDVARAVVGLLAAVWRWHSADLAASPPRRRGRAPGLHLVPELGVSLEALGAALRVHPAEPGARARAAAAAIDAARRLEVQGAVETAWRFATAGTVLDPRESSWPAAVGALARRTQAPGIAATWLIRAARLANTARRPADVCTSIIELAAISEDQDHHYLAARLLALAARHARHRGAPTAEGDALLALGVHRHSLGYPSEAEQYFADAVLGYSSDRDRLLKAGLTIARCWLDAGEFAACKKLLLAVIGKVTNPTDAAFAAAHLVRAAAACGDERVMEEWWNGAMGLLGKLRVGATTAAVLFDLARAAGTLGLWVRAEVAAEAALALAKELRDPALTGAAARIMAITQLPAIPVEMAREVFPDYPRDENEEDRVLMNPLREPLYTALTCALRDHTAVS